MNKWIRVILLYIVFTAGGAYADVSKLVALLEAAPDWTTFRYEADLTGEKARDLIRAYVEISRNHGVSECREAIRFIVEKRGGGGNPAQLNKLYVFNIIYFNIGAGQPVLHGGYGRGWAFDTDERVDLLAPLGWDEQAGFYLKYRALASMGPPYEPLKEFDFFNEKFGRRYPPGKEGK